MRRNSRGGMPSRDRKPCIACDAALRGRPVSQTSTRRRQRPRMSAALSPAGPAPTMMTSYMASSCHEIASVLKVLTVPQVLRVLVLKVLQVLRVLVLKVLQVLRVLVLKVGLIRF